MNYSVAHSQKLTGSCTPAWLIKTKRATAGATLRHKEVAPVAKETEVPTRGQKDVVVSAKAKAATKTRPSSVINGTGKESVLRLAKRAFPAWTSENPIDVVPSKKPSRHLSQASVAASETRTEAPIAAPEQPSTLQPLPTRSSRRSGRSPTAIAITLAPAKVEGIQSVAASKRIAIIVPDRDGQAAPKRRRTAFDDLPQSGAPLSPPFQATSTPLEADKLNLTLTSIGRFVADSWLGEGH